MSLARAVELLAGAPPAEDRRQDPALLALVRRLSPSEGWLTYIALLVSLLVVTWSVNLARWVETPSLAGLMVWASLTALVLAKVRLHGGWLHLMGLVVGGLLVYWQASTLAEADTWVGRFGDLNHRLKVWWDAVVSGGISTDLLPFGLVLAAFTWITGYAASWSVFRFRNVWGAILPGAVGLVANLSYLPDRFSAYLFLYLFFAALLMIRMNSLERQRRWEAQRTGYPAAHSLFTLSDGVWFALVVFLIAVLLPGRPAVSETLRDFWNQSRQPVDRVEAQVSRLLSQVPSRKENPLAQYGPHLPFQGPLHTTEDPVLYIRSQFPTYWRARVYGTYTSHGWLGEKTEQHVLPWVPPMAHPAENRSRVELEQTVTPAYPVSQLALGSTPLLAGQPVEVQVLPPKRYLLPVRGKESAALPPDLRRAFADLRAVSGAMGAEQLSQVLLQTLPDSVLVTGMTLQDARGGRNRQVSVEAKSEEQYPSALRKAVPRDQTFHLASLEVRRKQPFPPDVVAVVSESEVKAGKSYTVTSWVSVASEGELNRAATSYPGWVLDRYLQVPPSLPPRVRRLAEGVARDAVTPFEKASAIETYLRSQLTYDPKVQAPPASADGVDYFLFESKRGYSDYFASTMALMARSVGLPSRLVVGFAPGRFDERSDLFIVRDSDSHAWAEVYFPGYGWIEFEPTPGKGEIPRGMPLPLEEDVSGGSSEDPFALGTELPFDPAGDQEPEAGARAGASAAFRYALAGMALAAVLLLVLVAFWSWYRQVFVQVPAAALVYDRMARLGSLAGLGPALSQTPSEYASTLAARLPTLRAEIGLVAGVYAKSRYGRQHISSEESSRTLAAWRRIRGQLFRRLYRR